MPPIEPSVNPYRTPDGWCFHFDGREVGPYETRGEATDDMRGLKRWQRYKNVPGFLTSERDQHGQ